MMISEDTLEIAGLYALDLLAPDERERFERQLRIEPDLHRYVDEMRDTAAAVALTAPPATPSPQVLADVLARVTSGRPANSPLRSRLANFPWGWAAAACLTICLIIVTLSDSSRSTDPHSITREPGSTTPAAEAISTVGSDGGTETPATLLDRLESQLRARNGLATASPLERREALSLIQDVDRLRNELSALNRANESRFIANPRLARTVVVEMRSPDPQAQPPETADQTPLSDRVGDFISTALEDDEIENQPPPPPTPTEESAPLPAPETNTETPTTSGLPEDPRSAIPPNILKSAEISEIHKELVPGILFNQEDGTLWVQSADPEIFVEEPLPDGFDYDEFEDFAAQVTAPGSTSLTPSDPAPPVSSSLTDPLPPSDQEPFIYTSPVTPAPEPTPDPEPQPAPPVSAAYSIFEETTGKGSVVVANLPPLEGDETYQLWLQNSSDGKLVNVGTLPEVPAPVERFDFTLDTSGISPAGFVLTREFTPDAQHPSTDIILQGP